MKAVDEGGTPSARAFATSPSLKGAKTPDSRHGPISGAGSPASSQPDFWASDWMAMEASPSSTDQRLSSLSAPFGASTDAVFDGEGGDNFAKVVDALATSWHKQEASRGCSDAMVKLGESYDIGRGVSRNTNQAMAWFRRAASLGNADGAYYVARRYQNGNGVDRNAKVAADWFKKAAEGGHTAGMEQLSQCYEAGFGVEQDPDNADLWRNRAEEAMSASM